VAVILWQMVYQVLPFGKNPLSDEWLNNASQAHYEFGAKEVSDHCKNLLGRLLKADAEDRLPFDQFLAHPYISQYEEDMRPKIDKVKAKGESLIDMFK